MPDLTVLLKVDPEIGLQRRTKSGEINRLDMYPLDFHKRVEIGYDELVKLEPNRWKVVDVNQRIEEVYRDLVNVVENRLQEERLLEGVRRNIEG